MTTNTPDDKTRSHAGLANVRLMMELVRKLQGRRPHLPNIGVMHGPSGYGKTQAAIYAQNKTNAIRVEVGDSWTRKFLMKAILIELGIVPRGTVADMVQRAVEVLGEEIDRPLMIDEADKLVDKGMIELVREVAECSQAPVILIGEEALPGKLAQVERVHNRVLHCTAAEPCDRDDTRKLAALYVPHLQLTDGLLDRVCELSEGRARRIVTNLDHIAEWARNHGAQAVDEGYGGRFYTGDVPRVRTGRTLRRAA